MLPVRIEIRLCSDGMSQIDSVWGKKPADLPIIQPTKFEFVINRKVSQSQQRFLALADEVIE